MKDKQEQYEAVVISITKPQRERLKKMAEKEKRTMRALLDIMMDEHDAKEKRQ